MPIRSHFIPQFLLRGFAFRQEGEEFYVHVFRKDGSKFSPNIKGVAAPGNFYGNGAIETTLSIAETQFADLVRLLREGKCAPESKPLIDRFVAHSLIRTQAFRDGLHDIGVGVMRESFQEFLDPEHTPHLLAMLADDALNQPPASELLAATPPDIRPMVERVMREMLLHPDMHAVLRQMILPSLDAVDTAESVRSAQRQALENDCNLDKRIHAMGNIEWRIEQYETHSLILGDIGPLIRGDESKEWGRVLHGQPQVIWFPLSDRSLLIGEVPGTAQGPDCQDVNVASAENSIEFVVASQRTEREDKYHERIGSNVNYPTSDQLTQMKQTIREYLTSPGGTLTTD